MTVAFGGDKRALPRSHRDQFFETGEWRPDAELLKSFDRSQALTPCTLSGLLSVGNG